MRVTGYAKLIIVDLDGVRADLDLDDNNCQAVAYSSLSAYICHPAFQKSIVGRGHCLRRMVLD